MGPRCRRSSATRWPRASRRHRGSGSGRSCRSSPRHPPIRWRQPASDCGFSPCPSAAATRRWWGPGLRAGPGNDAYLLKTVAAKDVWVRPPVRAQAELTVTAPRPSGPRRRRPAPAASAHRGCCPTCSGWAATANAPKAWPAAEHRPRPLPRLPLPARRRRARMRVGAAGRAAADHRRRRCRRRGVAATPRTLWSLTVDRERSGSLAQSVERLGLSPGRCATRCPTTRGWCSAAWNARWPSWPPAAQRPTRRRHRAGVHARPDPGGNAGPVRVAAESMVRDVDWTMTDIGKRIERGLFLTALLRATLGTARSRAASS
ncbi:A predicted alpha-helical domain with a conserved ER motif family protein [Mycobacterium xenopi 4042]|uniref:A predicted alpha-helical domain with a conserved ER motif family protein n=1 Tax=Mycobacterium xenopi 4042 TaxID=1299334 RepID=X8BMT2_MYCXE|nr:A predicted alpha-helical domain with a conserved ER motif family protein [Mycobacterium xenopi 4042]